MSRNSGNRFSDKDMRSSSPWRPCQCGSLVGQPDAGAPAELRAVLIGLEPDGANAVGGELLVTVLGIAGHADRADDLAGGVADLQSAALREDLVAARAQE